MADRRAATAETVVQLMSQVERRPSRERAAEEPGTGRVLTIAALAEASSRLANAFIGLGLQRGQRVAYVAQNHLEYLVLEFALAKAGLVKVPLNFRFAPQELRALPRARRRPAGARRRARPRASSRRCSGTRAPFA